MSLISSPSTINPLSLASKSRTNLKSKTTLKNRTPKATYVLNNSSPPFSLIQFQRSSSPTSRHRGSSFVPFDAKNSSSGSGEDDHGAALETVLKLYSAIKNQSLRELSDIIADECRCVCNFFSFFRPVQGKKQVLEFFTYLIRSLGSNIEFVVQPTLHDGMNVGVSWRLEWNKNHVPLGKGFSFYICQVYQGKVFIRNVEMFMEPLLHIEPFRLKIMGYAMATVDKLSSKGITRKTVHTSLLVLFFTTVILLFSKPGFY